jgi:hypothetical protein
MTTGRELFRNRSLHDSDSQVFLNEVDSKDRIIYFECASRFSPAFLNC